MHIPAKVVRTSILEMERLSADQYLAAHKVPIIVVLDDVRSLHNVGAIFRTADAFRLEAVYLCGITGCPPHTLIHKTALGAEEVVPWRYFPIVTDALHEIHHAGRQILALEQTHQSQPLGVALAPISQGLALVVGNEVHGVSDSALECVDQCVEIPQYGTKHSLNVSVATGIALYQLAIPYLSQMN